MFRLVENGAFTGPRVHLHHRCDWRGLRVSDEEVVNNSILVELGPSDHAKCIIPQAGDKAGSPTQGSEHACRGCRRAAPMHADIARGLLVATRETVGQSQEHVYNIYADGHSIDWRRLVGHLAALSG